VTITEGVSFTFALAKINNVFMKKIFMLLVALATLNTTASAQADSVILGSGNQNMVFYNLQNGTKTTSSNTDWHLAFSVRNQVFPNNTLQSTTVRSNSGNGLAVYEIPSFTADSFAVSVDTTGIGTWNRVYDSDSLLDEGAFNHGKNIAVFNYGWGVYESAPTYNVVGKKVYLLILPSGEMKKLLIEAVVRDTAWVFKYADLNNANLQTQTIVKKDYVGKNFVYFNLLTNQVIDKEPLSSQWDLLFTKYAAFDAFPGAVYGVVGVLTNKGRTVYERANEPVTNSDYSLATFSPLMNTIGWDWKQFDNQIFAYTITDSLTYFVQTNNGVHKIYFTFFGGSSTGKIVFNTESFGVTGIEEATAQIKTAVYPNPSRGLIQVSASQETEIENIAVYNVSGAQVSFSKNAAQNATIDLNHLENGLYFLQISTKSGIQTQKLLLQR